MIKIKSDKIIADGKIISGYIYIEDGKISEISDKDVLADENYDFTGKYVSAGFIDLHTHGAGGHAFMNSDVSDVIDGVNYHFEHGTTSILPTISAGSFETMRKAVINIADAMESGKAKANIIGAHLEGPYLSVNQCGAQCPKFITEPQAEDYESLIAEYGKYIKRWTYAPEHDEGAKFCKYLTEHGIIASPGHSDAKYPDMKLALDNGASLITHLYSATSTVTRDRGFRSLGVIESAYLEDGFFVEIIADGKHLPPDLINLIIKLKGYDRVALITDSLEIAGTDITHGVMSGTEFIVEDGVCKLCDRTAFAGSIATTDRLVRVLVFECGVELARAIKMMTEVPAKILGINKGNIKSGFDADIVVFDENIAVSDIFVGGRKCK